MPATRGATVRVERGRAAKARAARNSNNKSTRPDHFMPAAVAGAAGALAGGRQAHSSVPSSKLLSRP